MSNWLATDESDSIFVRYSTFIIFSIDSLYFSGLAIISSIFAKEDETFLLKTLLLDSESFNVLVILLENTSKEALLFGVVFSNVLKFRFIYLFVYV